MDVKREKPGERRKGKHWGMSAWRRREKNVNEDDLTQKEAPRSEVWGHEMFATGVNLRWKSQTVAVKPQKRC